MNPEEILQFLIQNGRTWVQAQRDLHRQGGRNLKPNEMAALRRFFEDTILDSARIKRVSIVENPPFYVDLAARGIPTLLDFTDSEGITFVDTILISEKHHPRDPPLLPTLFHELVHAVQYSVLGRDAFVERYVNGWAEAGQDYFKNPMEKGVYQLQERYEAAPQQGFSVEAEVRRQLGLV